jgi:hypothetical protein
MLGQHLRHPQCWPDTHNQDISAVASVAAIPHAHVDRAAGTHGARIDSGLDVLGLVAIVATGK